MSPMTTTTTTRAAAAAADTMERIKATQALID